jgi:hypothetical protein
LFCFQLGFALEAGIVVFLRLRDVLRDFGGGLRVGGGGVLLAVVWGAGARVLGWRRDCEWAARVAEEIGGAAAVRVGVGGEDWLSAGCSRCSLREGAREEGFHLVDG